jgi:hypothetical protein
MEVVKEEEGRGREMKRSEDKERKGGMKDEGKIEKKSRWRQ